MLDDPGRDCREIRHGNGDDWRAELAGTWPTIPPQKGEGGIGRRVQTPGNAALTSGNGR
jgi:hypothetical protein